MAESEGDTNLHLSPVRNRTLLQASTPRDSKLAETGFEIQLLGEPVLGPPGMRLPNFCSQPVDP